MNPFQQSVRNNRRLFLKSAGLSLGSVAATAMGAKLGNATTFPSHGSDAMSMLKGLPHHAATAKRVIYLFQSGAPSQFESFDYKPGLKKLAKTELPETIRKGQRLTGIDVGPNRASPSPRPFLIFKRKASQASR